MAVGDGQEIVKLDPDTMQKLATIEVPGVYPSDITVGAGGVWVSAQAP